MEEKKIKILEELKKTFPDKIKEASAPFGDETIVIDRDFLVILVDFLRKEPHSYTMLLDLTCVDHMDRKPRFEIVFHLFSLSNNHRLRLKVPLPDEDPWIDSLTSIWKNANWLEREVFDMFGVAFRGHPDLRRIFMYDGFEGYPLRKDYPLRKRQPRIRLRK